MHFSYSVENASSDATGPDIYADEKLLIGGSCHSFDGYLGAERMQLKKGKAERGSRNSMN
jgi:hypothetical protein